MAFSKSPCERPTRNFENQVLGDLEREFGATVREFFADSEHDRDYTSLSANEVPHPRVARENLLYWLKYSVFDEQFTRDLLQKRRFMPDKAGHLFEFVMKELLSETIEGVEQAHMNSPEGDEKGGVDIIVELEPENGQQKVFAVDVTTNSSQIARKESRGTRYIYEDPKQGPIETQKITIYVPPLLGFALTKSFLRRVEDGQYLDDNFYEETLQEAWQNYEIETEDTRNSSQKAEYKYLSHFKKQGQNLLEFLKQVFQGRENGPGIAQAAAF